ncbi:nuclear transport factor 2 family protein [Mycobacterium kyogaense]|uniref:nuclear transport factor 2 family protein n=1 Tax=Mycobacterium kyogaense TaxID=2212479 RepID=UPI000DAB8A6C|nr:nuclear transport factor 2 family protein [Mycobacterium kyogaense]
MTQSDELSATAGILARVERLEAERDVRCALNEYFYAIDSGRVDDVMDLYRDDVEWSASNIPFGSGRNLVLHGRSQVRPVVESLGVGGYRHHGVNADIHIGQAGDTASTASYMLVVSRSAETPERVMLLGGLYEGTWAREPQRWRITSWHISHQWLVDDVGREKFFDGLNAGTLWDGRRRAENQ